MDREAITKVVDLLSSKSTSLRERIKTYLVSGMEQQDALNKAINDFEMEVDSILNYKN